MPVRRVMTLFMSMDFVQSLATLVARAFPWAEHFIAVPLPIAGSPGSEDARILEIEKIVSTVLAAAELEMRAEGIGAITKVIVHGGLEDFVNHAKKKHIDLIAVSSTRSIVPLEGMVEPYVLDLVEVWDRVLVYTLRSLSSEIGRKPIMLAVENLELSSALDIAINVAASLGVQLVIASCERPERKALEYVDKLSSSHSVEVEITRLEAKPGSEAVKELLCLSTSSSMIVIDKKLLEEQSMFRRRRFRENAADLLSYSVTPVVLVGT